jgi:hypothetical protein
MRVSPTPPEVEPLLATALREARKQWCARDARAHM